MAWHIEVHGGAAYLDADLRFDEQQWGAVGGELRLATPEAARAPDRYEIEIGSGAAHLEISAEQGDNRAMTPTIEERPRLSAGGALPRLP